MGNHASLAPLLAAMLTFARTGTLPGPEGKTMLRYALAAPLAVLLLSAASAQADITVAAPGVALNAGIPALADAYSKKSGVKVTV